MKDNTLLVVMISIVGAIFVYAAVKGQDPREIVKSALRKG
jgi:hypothetical protein